MATLRETGWLSLELSKVTPNTLRAGFWAARAAAFVLVCVLTLTDSGKSERLGFEVGILVGIGLTLGTWGAIDWRTAHRRTSPPWLLPLALGGLAGAGGLGSALGPISASVAFAVVAALGAGSELSLSPACAVTVAGVLGIEISGVIFGFTTGTALGLPLAVCAALLGGRNRREVRVRSEQAAELVTQMQLTQEEQRRVAALDERNRIAREIHDVLAHSISALGIQIGAARAVLGDSGDVEATLRLLDGAQHLAEEGLTDSRRAILALRTDTPPLPDSLASLAENHQNQHHRPVDLVVLGAARPLQPDATIALVRTTHEALTNAAKHAPGGGVHLTLDYGAGQTTLTIGNDASGQAPGPGPGVNGGFGLAGMRERLLLIGGTLSAGPTDTGWTVEAKVPQ
jgi:signal transduction histidine kinase